MSLTDSLEAAKDSLNEFKRKRRFRKANKQREEAAQLQSDLLKCRGKLESCRADFARTVRTQAANIRKGQSEGMDTLLQEQILWDAAVGYLLVRDAIYSIQTLNNYDSVDHAYSMLEQATKQMMNKRNHMDSLKLGGKKKRDEYGYITSDSSRKEKEQMLELIFEKVKQTGDIETCVNEANRSSYGKSSLFGEEETGSLEETMRRLRESQSAGDLGADVSSAPEGLFDLGNPTDGD
ncbi:MAG: hypothetical protein IKH34_06845 [Oscillospiraceae bacterium]|nr:hypothetical protein [Oscillospiraceae bacterium]